MAQTDCSIIEEDDNVTAMLDGFINNIKLQMRQEMMDLIYVNTWLMLDPFTHEQKVDILHVIWDSISFVLDVEP
jgi:hypothetical protein